jgi:HEAT repeat protein
LTFLPYAEDDGVLEEIRAALSTLAYADGKPEPALLAALDDPLSLRRSLAVEALCHDGTEPPAAIRKMLYDPRPSVRLRAALALAGARDAKAVSTLVTLLAELPSDQGRLAEEFLVELAGEQAPNVALGTDEASRRRCRDAWAAWWLTSEGPGLLEEVRKRVLTDENRTKGMVLVRRLGDDSFAVREKAAAEIKQLGSVMIPVLRQARQDRDVEVRQRAEALLAALEKDASVPLSTVTARLIGLRRPAGAAAALMAYLPFTEDEVLVTELQQALDAVAAFGEKPDPLLVRALSDPSPSRRGAAAEALCTTRDAGQLAAVRKLLADADPGVRLKASLGLAGARQREAIPVLIKLVGELPAAQGSAAEDYLLRLSGDQPPAGLPAGDGDARAKRRDMWAAWWAANGARMQLVDRYPPTGVERHRGYTMLVCMQNNQVSELGADGKLRWELTGLMGPWDAQVVGHDRVLVAEHNAQRVTERNLRGEIVWQKENLQGWPVAVQRLRNGNTFIACRNKILEVDRTGRELFSINRPNNDVATARKMRDGQILCVSTHRTIARLDLEGKELKSFAVAAVMNNGVEIMPNGNVLICIPWMNKVTEYDGEGKTVWEANVGQAWAACRIPGGNTLVSLQWPTKIIEVDREGKALTETATPVQVQRIHRR